MEKTIQMLLIKAELSIKHYNIIITVKNNL